MKKLFTILFILILASLLFACVGTESPTVREQTNTTEVSSAWQNFSGDIYVDISGISSNIAANISVGYAIGEGAAANWASYIEASNPIIDFDNIKEYVGSTIKLYTRLNKYTANDGVEYKESAISAPYSYIVKNIYDTESEWYRAKTTFKDTCSNDGEMLRDIAQSGVYGTEINSWDYTSNDGTMMFFDNIYYLNEAGLKLILKRLTVTESGENYHYTLLDPDVEYEYARVKNNQSDVMVWYTYSSLTGIIFDDADTIKLRIKGNADYCESIAFVYFDVQNMTEGNA